MEKKLTNFISYTVNKLLDRKYYFTKKINEKSILSFSFLLIILKIKLFYILIYFAIIGCYFLIKNDDNLRIKFLLSSILFTTIIESILCFFNLNNDVINQSLRKFFTTYVKNTFLNKDLFNNLFPIKVENVILKDILNFGIIYIEKNSLLINLTIIYLSFIYLLNFSNKPISVEDETDLTKKLLSCEDKNINRTFISNLQQENLEIKNYQIRFGKYYFEKIKNKKYLENEVNNINLNDKLKKSSLKSSFGFDDIPIEEENMPEYDNRKTPFPIYKKILFTHFVYLNLLIFVIYSCMNPCIWNLIYLFFALYYIRNPNLVINFDFEKPHNFIKNLIIILRFSYVELLIIAIYQSYDNYFNKNEDLIRFYINLFFGKLKYKKNLKSSEIENEVLFYILFKIFKMFLIFIQINIFESDQFRYYFKYISIKNQFNIKKKGLIRAYIFNNNRINRFKNNNEFIEKRAFIYNNLRNFAHKLEELPEIDKNFETSIREMIKGNQNKNIKAEYRDEFINRNDIIVQNDERLKKEKLKYTNIMNIILNKNENQKIGNVYSKEKIVKIIEILIYVLIISNSIFYPNIFIGIVIFSIFAYSLIFYPRTKSFFWKFIFYFTLIGLLAKYLLQLLGLFLSCNNADYHFPYIKNDDQKYCELQNSIKKLMKLINYNLIINNDSFYKQILYFISQFVGITLNLLMRTILIQNGLWDKDENEYECLDKVEERIENFKKKIYNVGKNFQIYKTEINEFFKDQIKNLDNNPNSSNSSFIENIFRKYEVKITFYLFYLLKN